MKAPILHNAGPTVATFGGIPGYLITDPDTGRCIYSCFMRAAIWWLRVGESRQHFHDTGAMPDLPGRYRLQPYGSSGDPASILSVDYELTPVVGIEELTWGRVKGLYR